MYIEVAVPIFSYSLFTYRIPGHKISELENKELIGRRVLIPFKTSGLTGIVVKETSKPDFDVKEILDFPDKEPVFSKKYIEILSKISEYYVYPLGLILYYAIPEGLRWELNKKTGNWIKKAEDYPLFIPDITTTTGIPNLSEKAKKLLEFILEKGEVSKEEIKEAGFSLNSLKTLIQKGLVRKESLWLKEEIKTPLKPYISREIHVKKGIYLFSSKKAEERLKTYLQIVNSNIKKKASTTIVFPNIKTAEKVFKHLKRYFGDKVFLYCDTVPNKEKIKSWFLLKKYSGNVVIGTYSSLFIPLKGLKTIIIEDEHSESYKTKRAPRIDIRRLAFEIYKKTDCSVIFSSSVPSVESEYSVKKKLILPFEKDKCILKENKGKIKIVGFSSIKDIEKKILQEIKEKKKTLIIGNKKGFSSFLYCKVCEEEIRCNQCDIPVRVHQGEKGFFLKCDICGKKYAYIENCPDCDFPLEKIGYGIEKIESLLKDNKIEFSYVEENRDTDVKLSVSLVGKELLVGNFQKVININPDFYLNIHDYKGEEKFFRNIVIPYLKAKEEYVLITNNENSVPVEAFRKKKLSIFYEYELENRKEWDYPPYSKLFIFTFEKKNLSLEKVKQIFEEAIHQINTEKIEYEGPFFSQISKVRGKNRIQVVVKNLKQKKLIKYLYEETKKKKINLIVEIV